jgi:hypothetical protein
MAVARNKERRELNREAYRRSDRCKAFRRKYGITASEYDEQWLAQGECCAICRRRREDSEKMFAVDHCHASGVVRGILCPQCNVDLGRIEKYLKEPDHIDAYLANSVWATPQSTSAAFAP